MGTGMISTGLTGIQVAQLGLLTTEHNITNASTAGFNRQRTIQASNVAMLTGSGYVGQGAHVQTISRMYDSFLSTQVNRAQTTSSELESYYTQIKQIDNMLADANSGVSPALQSFFSGIQDVAANPSLLSARQSLVSSAQALVARYQGLEDRVSQMYDAVNEKITTTVATINSYSTQIANLNEAIVVARSATNQEPNDLLDQRDQLVLELNKLVRVTTTVNSDGTFNVYVGNGQQLVVGSQVSKLTAEPSKSDPSRFVVGLATARGSQELPESLITGGSLGGLLTFRSGSLDRVANELGRNAASLALVFNAQNALGQDLLGQSVGDTNFISNFFTISQPKVYANTNNSGTATVGAEFAAPSFHGVYALKLEVDPVSGDPTSYSLTRQSDGTVWRSTDTPPTLASLGSAVPSSEGLDLSTASVDPGKTTQVLSAAANGGNFYTKLTGSDYRLAYDGTKYTMTRLSDNAQWSDASFATLSDTIKGSEGFSISSSGGTLVAGDSFIIKPVADVARNIAVNTTVAADVRLVAAAMPFRTKAESGNTGNGTITAGTTVSGFGTPAFPSGGVKLDYSESFDAVTSTTTRELTLTGVPTGANISVTVGDKTTVYSGPTIPYTSGATISFAGMSFSISGSLNNGDAFTLSKNASGVSDGRNALALGQLQSQNTMSGKTASFQAAYAQLVSDVGNKSRELQVKSDAQAALLKQATDARDSLSGVNLDEEAANLLRYQQAYQASAKMIEVGSRLFDVLLSAAGG
jgi:flagellar hook-associated protein 1 FlgK